MLVCIPSIAGLSVVAILLNRERLEAFDEAQRAMGEAEEPDTGEWREGLMMSAACSHDRFNIRDASASARFFSESVSVTVSYCGTSRPVPQVHPQMQRRQCRWKRWTEQVCLQGGCTVQLHQVHQRRQGRC